MPSWMACVQRQSGMIKVEGSARAFSGNYLGLSGECFIGVNINNRSKSLSDSVTGYRISIFQTIITYPNESKL